MKGKFFVVLLGLVFCLCVLSPLAKAEQQKARLFFVEEIVVKPSMIDQYETHMKEALVLWKKYGTLFSFYAFNTDDFHYYFVWPIENYASLDSLFKAIGEWAAKIGDKNWQALVKSGEDTHEYMKWSIVRHRPDLSYISENSRLKPEEASFLYLNLFYVLPGKEGEFERVLKEGVTFYKDINFPFGFDIYVGDVGIEMPMYIYLSKAKDAANFYAQHDNAFKLRTEEALKLRRNTLVAIRKIDIKTGMFRPDLSYMPKKVD